MILRKSAVTSLFALKASLLMGVACASHLTEEEQVELAMKSSLQDAVEDAALAQVMQESLNLHQQAPSKPISREEARSKRRADLEKERELSQKRREASLYESFMASKLIFEKSNNDVSNSALKTVEVVQKNKITEPKALNLGSTVKKPHEDFILKNEKSLESLVNPQINEETYLDNKTQLEISNAQSLLNTIKQTIAENEKNDILGRETTELRLIPKRNPASFDLKKKEFFHSSVDDNQLAIALQESERFEQKRIAQEAARIELHLKKEAELKQSEKQKAADLGLPLEEYQALLALELKEIPKFGTKPDPRSEVNYIIDPYVKGESFLIPGNVNILDRFNGVGLTWGPSSGQYNDCFFYSIIREYKYLLRHILKDELLVKSILAVPENPDQYSEIRRDLSLVRKRFFVDIKDNLDQKFDGAHGNTSKTIREVIEDIKSYENGREFRNLSVLDYLNLKSTNESFLEVGYADIFSVLYHVPVYVMAPRADYKDRLTLYNGTYFNVNKSGQPPIFVLHPGEGRVDYDPSGKAIQVDYGLHYSKLFIKENNL